MSDILVHQEDGVCTVSFNRLERKNSITSAMYGRMADAITAAADDAAVRTIEQRHTRRWLQRRRPEFKAVHLLKKRPGATSFSQAVAMASRAGLEIAGAPQIPTRVACLDKEEFDVMVGYAEVKVGQKLVADPGADPLQGFKSVHA